ncbi:hypothetical protein D9Q98_003881 [Chlorella vulgaris]|uniref:Sugar phosphate transporter domain-containing protein n=1 Tax=Chlorella vulgaris TaxID=3077 RepID=A0A9D4TR53_CHLVU|nr:hypothetical protein D9Q98_003881 [Chlorella vulgaris]
MAFSFVVLAPIALMQPWEMHRATLQKQWQGIACIGAFMALNIALNNISLLDISLSLNQIIRSAIPVVACGLAIMVESKYPTRKEAASLVVLTMGVMLAVWQGTATGKPYAICFSIAATICNGLMMTFSSKLMSQKLDVVQLSFYVAPVSLLCLAPFFIIFEAERFATYWPMNQHGAGLIMLTSSVIAVLYNLAHQKMIQTVSAVATTVLGSIKIVCLLILSATLLGEGKEFTLRMWLGCLLALAGFGAYSDSKLSAIRQGSGTETAARLREEESKLLTEPVRAGSAQVA